jgi:hypothetical protein
MPDTRIAKALDAFAAEFSPLEGGNLVPLKDKRTDAQYVECHIPANVLVKLATKDVPLDPEGQPEYRANREIVGNHAAFRRMKQDAYSVDPSATLSRNTQRTSFPSIH